VNTGEKPEYHCHLDEHCAKKDRAFIIQAGKPMALHSMARQLQESYQVSTMVTQMSSITLRIVSATRPHEAAVVVDPSLEEAYLLATGRQAVRT
jgi:hypothetical protein